MSDRGDFPVLLVDDEEGMRLNIGKILSLEGYPVLTAASGKEALELIGRNRVRFAFIDLRLPDMNGVELVERIDTREIPVVIITAYATVETAVRAMKIGASDYIRKPFDLSDICRITDQFYRRFRSEDSAPADAPTDAGKTAGDFVYAGRAMQAVVDALRKVRDSDIPVLLLGESGTGKELAAQYLHRSGKRSGEPFEGLNCSAIPRELLESELFGHEKGAFTGAVTRKPGKFEVVGGGTLFLDEIATMDPVLQAKLLRVLEQRSFEPVGATAGIAFAARCVAATNADLRLLVEEKRFRLDLYYRLKGITIRLPALRERREDIEPLVSHYLETYRRQYGKPRVELARETYRFLSGYSWPGNVRELKHSMESAVLLSDQKRPLLPGDFFLEEDTGGPGSLTGSLLEREEREAILLALRKYRYSRSLAAGELGMSRKTLYNKMKKYAIS